MDATDAAGSGGKGVDPLVGKVLGGRFEIEALINRGGMGKIYRATQQPLGRDVALKVLDIHDDGSEFRDRFFLEASLCAKLAHPNTIRIYDYGTTDDGIYYIAMEFIHGESLQHLLNRLGAMEPARVVHIGKQIAGALMEAHDCGIVHRDLKPGNLMVTMHGENEFVKVLDFGLVKELGKESELSRTGTVLGSPLYISPEQVHGDDVDGRADIYTTGLILYAMLMGRPTFDRGNPLHVLMQQTQKAPPPFAQANPDADVPAALEWVVMRCLEKDPRKRFASMNELLRALKACEKELRGEVSDLVLRLEGGMLVLPEGLEVSHEVRLADVEAAGATTRITATGATDAVSQPTLATSRPLNTSAIMLVGGGGIGLVLVGMGALLLAVVLGAVGWSMWGSKPEPVVQEVPVEVPVPVPVEPEVEAPKKVAVTLTTEPEGAKVERDGVALGVTPLSVTIAEGDEWIVLVTAPGYVDEKVRLAPDVPEPTVKLQKVRRSAPKPAPVKTPEPEPEPEVAQPPEPVPAPQPPPRPTGGDMRDPWED
jgi:serine/threonine-protein kinase